MSHARIALFGLAFTALVGCSAVEQMNHMFGNTNQPTVAIKDTTVVSMTDEFVTVRFDIELSNNFDSALPVWGIKYTLMSEGQQLITGDLEVETALLPRSKRLIPINVELSFAELCAMLTDKGPGSIISYATIVDVAVDGPTGAMSLPSLKFVSKLAVPGMGPVPQS
jgi:LEA14-like dessication related protein